MTTENWKIILISKNWSISSSSKRQLSNKSPYRKAFFCSFYMETWNTVTPRYLQSFVGICEFYRKILEFVITVLICVLKWSIWIKHQFVITECSLIIECIITDILCVCVIIYSNAMTLNYKNSFSNQY